MARLEAGDFYILCPDNDFFFFFRPPLSRWHPDYAEAFAAFVKKES